VLEFLSIACNNQTFLSSWVPAQQPRLLVLSFIGVCSVGWLLTSSFSSIIGTPCGAKDSSYCGEFEICIVSPTCVWFNLCLACCSFLLYYLLVQLFLQRPIQVYIYDISSVVVGVSFVVIIDSLVLQLVMVVLLQLVMVALVSATCGCFCRVVLVP
jgi:hypothetical protein